MASTDFVTEGQITALNTKTNTSLGGKFKAASISGNVITFTKGDGTTTTVTLPASSGGGTASTTDFTTQVTN